MMHLEQIDHLALRCASPEVTKAWYVSTLGLEDAPSGHLAAFPIMLRLGSTFLNLFPQKEGEQPSTKGQAWHLALRAPTYADFQAAQTELKARNVAFQFREHEISHSIYFTDPDGFLLEITTYDLATNKCLPMALKVHSLRRNRSIPDAVIIPELAYPDVPAAAEWLCAKFGFRERLRIANHRIQLSLGPGAVVVTEMASGAAQADSAHSVLVRIEDVDEHHAKTSSAGVRIIRPPQSYPFGERQYTAADFAGHVWTFSQTIDDVDPASWGGLLHPE